MKRGLLLCLLSAAVFPLIFGCGESVENKQVAEQETVEEPAGHLGFSPDTLSVFEDKVRNGEFFSTLLIRLGLSAEEAYRISETCDTVFDVRSLRVGNAYHAYYRTDTSDVMESREKLEYLVYDKDRVNSVIFRCRPPYEVWSTSKPVTMESKYADVTITSSLWNDMIAADVSPLLILSLSDIYAWTVDFFGLQKGDRFRVFYDEQYCDGRVLSVDTVRYAVFTHAGVDYPAVMFDQKDGGNIYWNEKGESMRKAFLKAPLKYSRISSGFSYSRRHPITRKVQPHTGVDYAAPAGTPVMSIGDGVVTSRKNEGAGGNTVRIRHNSVYSTAYLHLSRFASGIQPGKRVKQGDVIGYVGSTGRSTGPHLDFRVWKNGSPVNPLKMDSPPAEPLDKANMEAFKEVCVKYSRILDVKNAEYMVSELFQAF